MDAASAQAAAALRRPRRPRPARSPAPAAEGGAEGAAAPRWGEGGRRACAAAGRPAGRQALEGWLVRRRRLRGARRGPVPPGNKGGPCPADPPGRAGGAAPGPPQVPRGASLRVGRRAPAGPWQKLRLPCQRRQLS